MPHKLILLRHGQSVWNLENRFTGWTDVELTNQGRDEARAAGELLRAEGLAPGISDDEIVGLNIPTGVPLIYELDDDLGALRHEYLGDAEETAAKAAAVAAQASASASEPFGTQ